MTKFNYDGITNASYMSDPAVRSWCEEQARAANPGADETTIHLLTERMFHQYPVVLMLAECEKRLSKALKDIETAQYRNTTQDKKTDRELKTLKADLADEKKAAMTYQERAEAAERKSHGLELQIKGLMKGQRS